jgi:polyisoprenoid-binding protein YceI
MKKSLFIAALCASAGVATAAPVTYEIDPAHTYPSFEADHMGISFWRGKFNKSKGKVVLDKEAGAGTVDIEIDMDSADFGQDALNKHVKGKDFFDVKKFAKARYKGTLAGWANGAPTRVDGELTMHGVTKPVTLNVSLFKCIAHPMFKRDYCGADASATIDREAFGINAGKDYGFKMDVSLRIQVEALAAK